jgi:hypothetical protein
MQSAVCDPASEAAAGSLNKGEDEATTQSAAKADPAPNEAFNYEMDRLRNRLRKSG